LHSVIVKEIQAMIKQGGRGTESDLFRQYGRYLTLSQRYANKEACPNCQSAFVKEAYMGGSVYYCPVCQPVIKS
jgi:formamidopyrimidine-DNA glycosylase